jgi:hypothetical protein
MGRRREYASATERKRAQRARQRAAALQVPCDQRGGLDTRSREATTAQLTLLQAAAAPQHVGTCGRLAYWPAPCATPAQRTLQAALKERDMLDALWTLQTLIADFGYDEVYTHVLQYVQPPSAIP